MVKKRRAWPDKRRAKQAENMRKTQPWKTTTGPNTLRGKAASCKNALKSGLHTAEIKHLRHLLKLQSATLKIIDFKMHNAKTTPIRHQKNTLRKNSANPVKKSDLSVKSSKLG